LDSAGAADVSAVLDEVAMEVVDTVSRVDVSAAGMEDDCLRIADGRTEGECCTRKRSGQVAI